MTAPWNDYNLVHQLEDASKGGRYSEVLTLLRRGANPDGYSSLHNACRRNHPDCAEALLLWGADPGQATNTRIYGYMIKSSLGDTPLHWACLFNSLACVKVLLDNHSPTDIKNNDGLTPIEVAKKKGHHEVVRFIEGWTPPPRDPLTSYPSIYQLSKLPESSQPWELADHLGLTEDEVRHIRNSEWPTTETFLAAMKKKQLQWKDIVEGLMRVGDGQSALTLSVRYGLLDYLKYLVDTVGLTLPDSVHFEGSEQSTLKLALANKRQQVAKYLLTQTSFDNGDGQSALALSVRYGWLDGLKYLVDTVGLTLPDSVHFEGSEQYTLELALGNEHQHVAKYLLTQISFDNGDGQSALALSVCYGWLDGLKYLVDTVGLTLPGSVHFNGYDQLTLGLALVNEEKQVAKYLLTQISFDDGDDLEPIVEYSWLDGLKYLVDTVGLTLPGDGQSLLALSVHYGWLDGLTYLVDTVGLTPPDSVHFEGSEQSTLELALTNEHLPVAKYLIAKKIGGINDSLICAVKRGHCSGVELLLSEGHADPNATDSENCTVLALSTDSRITIALLKHGAQADNVYKTHSKQIGQLSSQRPPENPLPILITGDGGVGKSTFLKSMLSGKGFLSFLSKRKPVTGVDEKTVGIIPYEVDTKEFGRVTYHDFAGQREFYASHCAILENAVRSSPPIIIYIADLREEHEQKTIDSIARWMTLVQNQCTHLTDKAHVIVIGSHRDILEKNNENPWNKEHLFAPIIKKFPKLEFVSFTPMDCRFSDTNQIKEVKKIIQKSSAVLRSPEVVSLNAHTFYIYILDSFKDNLAVSLKDVQQQVHTDLDKVKSKRTKNLLSFIPSTLPHLVDICQQLSKKGLILYLHNEEHPERSFIICDRATLLSKVTGTVFAPESFRQHCKLASSTGVVPLFKFVEEFKDHDIDMLIAFMSHLELCFEIKDKEVLKSVSELEQDVDPNGRYLFFPGLIRIETPDKVWEDDPTIACYFGWIIETRQSLQFFDPRCLQVLILRLVFTFNLAPATLVHEHIPSLQRFSSVWKNGIFWCNDDGVLCHLELSDNGKCFVLKMRSRSLKSEFLSTRFQIISKILETVRDFCPNIDVVELIINPLEVIKHPLKPVDNLTLCRVSDVVKAIVLSKKDVKHESGSLTLSQLLQFEPYAGLDKVTIQFIHSEKNVLANTKISDTFISRFVDGSQNITICLNIFDPEKSPDIVYHKHDLIQALETWRDKTEGTYSCLRETLNKYSIFTGRNPLDLAGVAHSECDPLVPPGPDQLPLTEVEEAIKEVCADWYSLAVELEISHGVRKAIEREHSSVQDRCATMLKCWIRRVSPLPSWTTLIRALRSSAINRGDIADKISNRLGVTDESLSDDPSSTPLDLGAQDPLSVDKHIKMVRAAVWDVRAKWFDLGSELGIDMGTLQMIKSDHLNESNPCLTRLIENWLTMTLPPTMSALLEALKSPPVGREDIATNIQARLSPLPT